MTIRHMKIFLKVYQTENITRAAEALAMTQPAVSRAVRELETYYGVQLFERINRRLHVTEAGRRLYTYALHIVSTMEEMERGLRNWDELGVLRVGTTVTIGNYLLPGVLKCFQARHPGLQLQAAVSNGARVLRGVEEDRLDFAVVEGAVSGENLCKREIAPDQLVLIMPPEDSRQHRDSLTLEELEQDRLLLREEGSMGRSLVDHIFERHNLTVEPYLESSSSQAIMRAVHEGLGISFLPEQLVREPIATGFLSTHKLSNESLWRPNYLVWHRQKLLTASAREMMELFAAASKNTAR